MNRKTALRSSAAVALVWTALACSPAAGVGCPWTPAPVPSIQPPTSCLAAVVVNPDERSSSGGCVEPDVSVTNSCPEALDVTGVRLLSGNGAQAADGGAEDGVTIAAGGSGVFQIEYPYLVHGGDGAVSVTASLGDQSLVITVTVSGGPAS